MFISVRIIFNQALRASLLTLALAALPASAMKPIIQNGMLLLQPETQLDRTKTGYMAIICGAQSWLITYQPLITQFLNTHTTVKGSYDPLKGQVLTATNLAALIGTQFGTLGLPRVGYDENNALIEALNWDHNHATSAYNPGGSNYDPFYLWKWRALFMETALTKNNSPVPLNANCHGTAAYLDRNMATWMSAYDNSRSYFLEHFASNPYYQEWGGLVPYVFVDQWDEGHIIWDDTYSYAKTNFWDPKGVYSYPRPINQSVNAFDYVRFPALDLRPVNGGNFDWTWRGLVFENAIHSASYLMSDSQGRHWVFEKCGPFMTNQTGSEYRIWAYAGVATGGANCYGNKPRVFIIHDNSEKLPLASSFDLKFGYP